MNTPLPEWLRDLDFPLDKKMGFEMHELTAERVVGSIPVEGNTQPFGLLHGGASAVLLESLASMGAVAHGMPMNKVAVGVDLNITHIRSATRGRVTGVATALHLGRRTAIYAVEITDDEGRRTAIGRLTCQMIERPAG
ncbi:MAG: PaaI family thioesterase [Arachnia sp.]